MEQATAGQRRVFSWSALALIAILAVAALILSNAFLRTQRLDLTQDKLFTLSKGTRSILHRIDEPIVVRFFFSSRLAQEIPQVALYAQRVRDLLEEYAAESNGKLKLQILDPVPFTDVEDQAVGYGLQGVPVDQGGDIVYFGLAGTNSTGDVQTVPFFDQSRERFLEYDLTRLVWNLANPNKRTVGLMTSLPIMGNPMLKLQMPNAPDDSWMIAGELKDAVDIQQIGLTATEIPDKIDTLLLIHPKYLSDATLYALDQFVMRGGKLILFIDPNSEIDQANPRMGPGGRPMPQTDISSNLPKLMKAWGVTMPADKAVGDLVAARRVQVPTGDSQTRVAAIDYPMWMSLTAANLDQDDRATANLDTINMASAGYIEKDKGAKIEFTPLITTSKQGGLIDASKLQGYQPDPLAITRDFKPTGQYVLAARLHGEVNSAFPDGPPALPKDAKEDDKKKFEAEKKAFIAKSKGPANIVIVADTDMLSDNQWVRVQNFFGQRMAVPIAQNASFLLNTVDTMIGDNDLIGLRSRGSLQRPFTLIQDVQRQAEHSFRAKEQELMKALKEAQSKLKALQGGEAGKEGSSVITPEQRTEIDKFRAQALKLRRELRDVQYDLRRDVNSLQTVVKAVNIALMPLLVALFAIVMALARRSSRRAARRSAAHAS